MLQCLVDQLLIFAHLLVLIHPQKIKRIPKPRLSSLPIGNFTAGDFLNCMFILFFRRINLGKNFSPFGYLIKFITIIASLKSVPMIHALSVIVLVHSLPTGPNTLHGYQTVFHQAHLQLPFSS